MSVATVPGLSFTAAQPPAEPSPLRSDVAGFIGRTRRGPVCSAIRVEGWNEYLQMFGGLAADAVMTYAIRGYFENGGQVAYIIRLCHPSATTAAAGWQIGNVDAGQKWTADSPSAFINTGYRIEASSPGAWANNTRVMIRYRLRGAAGTAEVDLAVTSPDEPSEYFTGLSPNPPVGSLLTFAEEVSARSRLIRLIPSGKPASAGAPGPHAQTWEITLGGGLDALQNLAPGRQEYAQAITKLGDENEVAIVAVPGLYDDMKSPDEQSDVLVALIEQAEQLRDRLVLVDVQTDLEDTENKGLAIRQVEEALRWIDGLRASTDDRSTRAAAIYHPRLSVPDPLGGIRRPLRNIPPSGHVAGVISRLDRQRGAHHTPANAPLYEAVDVTQRFDPPEQGRFNAAGVNLLRCFAGSGLQVWGGRTLNLGFVAHRRLIHRLVRAIRRVAEPLVFEANVPEMWLALVRAVTTVLLEAWRTGALKGARPAEAFRVRCDEKLNPPEEQELGRVMCEIEVAPAAPMEFILLRVALSGEGRLEVFES